MNHTPLIEWIQTHLDTTYPLHSRTHPLNHCSKDARWFVKREDELSFGISGSKYRKYASLIPYLKKHHYKTVHLVGSSYSNHLVGILQLLNEHQINAVLYVLGSATQPLQGNYGFIRLLLGEQPIHFLSKEEWHRRDTLVKSNLSSTCCYIPEGGNMFASLPGALSLPFNISHNQLTLGITFDHLFIDAGTGLSAIGLILGISQAVLLATTHVVLMAGSSSFFEEQLLSYKEQLENQLGYSLSLPKYHLYPSAIGTSFGSINTTLFAEIHHLASKEGLLCDPIYTAKLFYTAKAIQNNQALTGNLLCIHSGGGLSLSGFPQLFQ